MPLFRVSAFATCMKSPFYREQKLYFLHRSHKNDQKKSCLCSEHLAKVFFLKRSHPLAERRSEKVYAQLVCHDRSAVLTKTHREREKRKMNIYIYIGKYTITRWIHILFCPTRLLKYSICTLPEKQIPL
jgi:hypothetical protein